ncbi:MAG TPA: hypothetical protein VEK79_12890 [Thermoanaerobaculia bacterium]|nr:hypothetical protein [Thermoanaerobaculia bacterium]
MSTPETVTHVHPLKKYETVVSSGQAALRALLTMNGGATVAFLTFIGHLWEKGTLPRDSVHVLVSALQFFIYGTFFAVLAYGTIFLTNCLSSVDWHRSSNAMFVVTVLGGLASILCFLAASWRAVEGFQAATRALPT